MKKISIIIEILVTILACSQEYNKGKKGNFTFRKCSSCKITDN